MINFVPLLRADRQREINEYKSKGYIFRNGEPKYKHVRNFYVANYKKDENLRNGYKIYTFQVRTNHEEPRFYIVTNNGNNENKESCVYLTIEEIYTLLRIAAKALSYDLIEGILTSKMDTSWHINYTSLEFEFKYFSCEIPLGYIGVPGSNIKITYEELFVLIALIQSKSNYYWSISSDSNKEAYCSGILRLLACLINTEGHEILEKHGWKFIGEEYVLLKDNIKEKYYLTQDEYNNIMGGEKS